MYSLSPKVTSLICDHTFLAIEGGLIREEVLQMPLCTNTVSLHTSLCLCCMENVDTAECFIPGTLPVSSDSRMGCNACPIPPCLPSPRPAFPMLRSVPPDTALPQSWAFCTCCITALNSVLLPRDLRWGCFFGWGFEPGSDNMDEDTDATWDWEPLSWLLNMSSSQFRLKDEAGK